MNLKQGQALMEDIYGLMDTGKYSEADILVKKLLQSAETKGWQQLLNNALEMGLVIAIETNNLSNAEQLADKLAKQPPTAYGIFLQARLLMMKGKMRKALETGREAFAFAENHHESTPKIMYEKICNLLAKILSNYGEHDEALKYYWQSVEAADTRALKALEYSNYLFNLFSFCNYIWIET